MEEGSPMIGPGKTLFYNFTPRPKGTRWYLTTGSDVVYKYATINQHMLGSGDPLRVKKGQRVLMRLLNASATENVLMAFPGHTFKIVSMDGNSVPTPRSVEVLSLAVAERVDAIVEMNTPGIWVLGSTLEKSRAMGLGIVVEYEGLHGQPVWKDPDPVDWDYTQFGSTQKAKEPDETFVLTFRDVGPMNGSQFEFMDHQQQVLARHRAAESSEGQALSPRVPEWERRSTSDASAPAHIRDFAGRQEGDERLVQGRGECHAA
jgi:FtsP/CotA-like multicopper oxidase with cupredoxin domain